MGLVARAQQGELEGREKDGAILFPGIPYAAPPVGERRFRPPAPHEGWRGVREAKRFGPAAPQLPGQGPTAQPEVRWDEDCLTLNVCTPALDDARRPVLFWIHGGGFQTGQGGIPWYSGARFARRGDVVTVSINYRLGALGFAHLAALGGGDVASSGLLGILDQIAALRWVRENIAAFGGDPERVTIAGESAGGMSVGTLLGCPEAKGLFRAAIPQSGAAHHVLDAEKASEVGLRFAEALGAESVDELRRRPVGEILEAQRRVAASYEAESRGDPTGLGGMPFRPVVEGRVLPQAPLDAIRAGLSRDVRVLIGSNADETTLWGFQQADEARARRIFARHLPDAPQAYDVYAESRPGATPGELVVALTTDHLFRIPAVRLAEAQHGAGGASWKYLFSWRSRGFGGALGATHALEIPFAFANLDKPGVDVFLGEGEPPWPLAERMHAAWTAFVRRGAPDDEEAWPRYDGGRRPVMEFGERVGLLHDPGAAERALWDGVR